jgi:hypothetical protein
LATISSRSSSAPSGDPTTDLVLGALGAIAAGLAYEIVAHIRGAT